MVSSKRPQVGLGQAHTTLESTFTEASEKKVKVIPQRMCKVESAEFPVSVQDVKDLLKQTFPNDPDF